MLVFNMLFLELILYIVYFLKKLKHIILFSHVLFPQNAIFYKMLNLGVSKLQTQFSHNYFLLVAIFFSQLMVVCLKWYLHFKLASWGSNIYQLKFEDKSVKILSFHIWNQFHKTLKSKSSWQTFKISLSDWFRPKCKCKGSW